MGECKFLKCYNQYYESRLLELLQLLQYLDFLNISVCIGKHGPIITMLVVTIVIGFLMNSLKLIFTKNNLKNNISKMIIFSG